MKNLETLRTSGIAMLPYDPVLRAKVESAAAAWQNFTELSQAVKERMGGSDSITSVGYEIKNGLGPNADRKENFDITSVKASELPEIIELFDDPAATSFVQQALDIAIEMKKLAADFGKAAENEFAIAGLEDMVTTGDVFLRFLNYFGQRKAGELIAEPHVDNSGFTFHLFETDTGCQRLDRCTRQWIDMPVHSGETAVFPAMQLQLVSNGELRALSHRVVATDSTKDLGRQAVVCFVRLGNAPLYDKEKFGRLQEYTPGFNYDTNQEDFRKLFR